jgi:heme-degrading monooxygenase HmoA
MIHILGKVAHADLARFIATFATRGAELRRQHGSHRAQLFAIRDEEHRAIVLLEWESRAAFETFLADPAVRESMQAGGATGRPEFTYLDKIAEFPG